MRRQGCHSPRLLFDHSIQHLGIEGVGRRFRVLPLLGGMCGEPGRTEVRAMGGWLSLSLLPLGSATAPLSTLFLQDVPSRADTTCRKLTGFAS